MISPPFTVVIMGVSGCGKSTLGSQLALATGFRFIEGDDLHPASNVTKMSEGVALVDADRWPWLERVARELDAAEPGGGSIVSCSALKRAYRDFIRARVRAPVMFVFPEAAPDILLERLKNRPGHYMLPSLLNSQIATLERPRADEAVYIIDGTSPVEKLTADILILLANSH